MAVIEASQQPLAALGIGVYVVFILFVTKVPYEMMIWVGTYQSGVLQSKNRPHDGRWDRFFFRAPTFHRCLVSSGVRIVVDGIHMVCTFEWKSSLLVPDRTESE